MISNINVFDPTRVFILVPDTIKERKLSNEEKKINKLSYYVDKLDNIYFNSIIYSQIALFGILFNINIQILISNINWIAVLISLIIPLSIYVFGLIFRLISVYLRYKKVKLESKLSR